MNEPNALDPMIGAVLEGRYEIVEAVGRGGAGIVYRARQVSAHDRDVAIKIMNRSAAAASSFAARFENEARIIARLRHPNTIQLFDSGRTADGRLYIVTEFLQGAALSDLAIQGPMPQALVVRILVQIADSLAEAHENGVIHRDLKPANIFLESVGSRNIVKVLDFGIAKLVDAARLTAPMQIFGTPGFMSPEQCMGARVDERSDLYSLGVVAYVCLTGTLPIIDADVSRLLSKTIEDPPRALSTFPFLTELEPDLAQLIMELLEKEPEARPPSAGAVRDILENIAKVLDQTAAVGLPYSAAPAARPPSDEHSLAETFVPPRARAARPGPIRGRCQPAGRRPGGDGARGEDVADTVLQTRRTPPPPITTPSRPPAGMLAPRSDDAMGEATTMGPTELSTQLDTRERKRRRTNAVLGFVIALITAVAVAGALWIATRRGG